MEEEIKNINSLINKLKISNNNDEQIKLLDEITVLGNQNDRHKALFIISRKKPKKKNEPPKLKNVPKPPPILIKHSKNGKLPVPIDKGIKPLTKSNMCKFCNVKNSSTHLKSKSHKIKVMKSK